MKLTKIISGGQTGADQGGLFAARTHGIETGGWAPRGWKTEAGPAPWLADFGLHEHVRSDYSARTRDNILEADYTIIFGKKSPGSEQTRTFCVQRHQAHCWVPFPNDKPGQTLYTISWELYNKDVRTLNIAGNRESVNPGIQKFVEEYVGRLIRIMSALPDMPDGPEAEKFDVDEEDD